MKEKIVAAALTGVAALGVTGCTTESPERAHSPAITQTPSEATPSASPSLDATDKLLLEIDARNKREAEAKVSSRARVIKAQEKLTAISSDKIKEFVSTVENNGYTDKGKYRDTYRRLVVKAPDGTVYTDEVDYIKKVGAPNNKVAGVTVYIRKPGEEHAQHVVTDGVFATFKFDNSYPMDGKVDQAIGYTDVNQKDANKNDISDVVDTYGSSSMEVTNAEAIESKGAQAQADLAKAVDITLARY